MTQPLFLKLGGSLITDKTGFEAPSENTITRLVNEIAEAFSHNPELQLVLGHGSGSFGHVAAAVSGTRQGVYSSDEWFNFARVSDAAARLNRLVVDALLAARVPAISLQPSASAICEDGKIVSLATKPVQMALDAGLLPVIYGDVSLDTVRGGTIISTEEILMSMAKTIRPSWLLLAGETAGVYNENGEVVQLISASSFEQLAPALGGSRGTDVTGGMISKVRGMLDMVTVHQGLRVRIFSGLEPDLLLHVLMKPVYETGTEISS
jgi:isopentenyl phosphate kinase